MSARGFASALRPAARQLTRSSAGQKRTFVAALNAAARTSAVARPAVAGIAQQQIRGIKTIDFAGVKEDVYGEPAPSRIPAPLS